MDAVPAPGGALQRLALPDAERRHFPLSFARARAGARARDEVRRAPETLHPALWLGHQLGRIGGDAVTSGSARLDAELPGGGWPRRALAELLLPHAGVGEIRLLAPALVAAQRAGRLVMVFDPPAVPVGGGARPPRLRRRGAARRPHARASVAAGRGALRALRGVLRSLRHELQGGESAGARGAARPAATASGRSSRRSRAAMSARCSRGCRRGCAPSGCAASSSPRTPTTARPSCCARRPSRRPTAAPLRLDCARAAPIAAVRVLKRRGPPLEAPLRSSCRPSCRWRHGGARWRAPRARGLTRPPSSISPESLPRPRR